MYEGVEGLLMSSNEINECLQNRVGISLVN